MNTLRAWLRAIDARLGRRPWYRIGRNALVAFNRRDGSRMAAAMTYFAVFSLFPFVLLMMALLSFAIDSQEAQASIVSLMSDFLPAGSTGVQEVIEGVIAARETAAGLGAVLLLWGAAGWFEAIDRSINEMWGVEVSRPFIRGKLFALAMISGIALVMFLSWAANIAVEILQRVAVATGLAAIPGSALLWDLAIWAVTLGLMFLMFLLLYRYSPMCNLRWGDVWGGALVTAVAWTVVRSGFALYVTRLADYSSAYGPIAAVIAFLYWFYLAHTIILFGAGLTYSMRLESQGIHEPRDLPCAMPAAETNQDGRGAAAADSAGGGRARVDCRPSPR